MKLQEIAAYFLLLIVFLVSVVPSELTPKEWKVANEFPSAISRLLPATPI
jgi:hypothetical protein